MGVNRTVFSLFVASMITLTLMPRTSSALELGVFAGAAYGNLHTLRRGGLWGPAGNIGAQLQFSDYWGVSVDANASYHFKNDKDELPATSVLGTSFQLKYYVDVFEYIPYFGLGPTFFIRAPDVANQASSFFGGKFTFGIDKRINRKIAIGVFGDMYALASDLSRYPIYSMVGLRFVYHIRL